MRNIKAICQYEGTDFCGFQKQENVRTVQGTLEEALEGVLKEKIKVVGAGRTDSGVHALGQVVSFVTERSIPTHALLRAVNCLLPPDLRIIDVEEVQPSFHARYSAVGKCYEYHIWNNAVSDVFRRRFSHQVIKPLDVSLMNSCATVLVGRHDFKSFQAAGSPRVGTIRNLKELSCSRDGDLVIVRAAADGFLYKMVRNLVGCLIEAGHGRISPEKIGTLADALDRTKLPATAPAQGLFLTKVEYEDQFSLT